MNDLLKFPINQYLLDLSIIMILYLKLKKKTVYSIICFVNENTLE